ncbi:MAG: hypothetical protein P1V81_12780 [Planctomycetota bacterium]|nr:hypothetical protein [Planctomycetota bacterium]
MDDRPAPQGAGDLPRVAAVLDARRHALLVYSLKLTRHPQRMVRADVQRLRTAGLTDTDVLHLAELVAYYAYVNRIADGLGVQLERAD